MHLTYHNMKLVLHIINVSTKVKKLHCENDFSTVHEECTTKHSDWTTVHYKFISVLNEFIISYKYFSITYNKSTTAHSDLLRNDITSLNKNFTPEYNVYHSK